MNAEVRRQETRWAKHRKEYKKFDRVQDKLSQRRDMHAFMLLDRLFPNYDTLVSQAEDYGIWLEFSREDIHALTDEQIIELVRCGVQYVPHSHLHIHYA